MAGLTTAIGRVRARLEGRVVEGVQRVLLGGSVALGLHGLVGG